MTKNLTSEGREMVNNLTALLSRQKNSIDIHTRAGIESVQIEPCFTGQIVLHFNEGGFAGAEKNVKMKLK
jgi:hypothetical protein